jgi:hypothetical protein
MHPNHNVWILGLMLVSAANLCCGQEDSPLGNFPTTTAKAEGVATPSLTVSSESELAAYEADLRYRMILQMVGFIIVLGVLHLIQVKLKIQRAYFWLVVGGVILGLVLNSYRPQVNTSDDAVPVDTAPTYAPTRAQ